MWRQLPLPQLGMALHGCGRGGICACGETTVGGRIALQEVARIGVTRHAERVTHQVRQPHATGGPRPSGPQRRHRRCGQRKQRRCPHFCSMDAGRSFPIGQEGQARYRLPPCVPWASLAASAQPMGCATKLSPPPGRARWEDLARDHQCSPLGGLQRRADQAAGDQLVAPARSCPQALRVRRTLSLPSSGAGTSCLSTAFLSVPATVRSAVGDAVRGAVAMKRFVERALR